MSPFRIHSGGVRERILKTCSKVRPAAVFGTERAIPSATYRTIQATISYFHLPCRLCHQILFKFVSLSYLLLAPPFSQNRPPAEVDPIDRSPRRILARPVSSRARPETSPGPQNS